MRELGGQVHATLHLRSGGCGYEKLVQKTGFWWMKTPKTTRLGVPLQPEQVHPPPGWVAERWLYCCCPGCFYLKWQNVVNDTCCSDYILPLEMIGFSSHSLELALCTLTWYPTKPL